ncbi:MAG: hypothetical protein JO001_01500 [Alphaproteobacteria bacterium]|nr:hypothetical protein [Alphaproteobacteria bacterium]
MPDPPRADAIGIRANRNVPMPMRHCRAYFLHALVRWRIPDREHRGIGNISRRCRPRFNPGCDIEPI